MILTKAEIEFEYYGLDNKEIAREDKTFNDYLLKKAKDIPDSWNPYEKRYGSDKVPNIKFTEVAPELKIYIKAFALEQLSFVGNEAITVNSTIKIVYNFLTTIPNFETLNVDFNFEANYEVYLEKLRDDVRNIVKNEKSKVVKTARGYAVETLKFIAFLGGYSNQNSWANNCNITASLPKKLAKYFNKKELQTFQNELIALQTENKTRSIPWGTMYEIMKFIHVQPPSHIKTAIVVMGETGLRISEVRELKVDCLEPVSEIEQLAVKKYFERIGKSAPINLDYSESYWLKYHVVKHKGAALKKGTPILVGKTVKKVIDEQIELTAELREEFGSDMLFLNKNRSGIVSIRSYSAFLQDRDKLVKKGMLFLKFHQLRATFATILHRLGVPLGMIEKYMNHVSSEITLGYINSLRNENMNLFNKILDDNIVNVGDNKNYDSFAENLLTAVENNNFAGLSHNSQMKMFERLMRKHNIKLSSSDYGTCILPSEKECPNGYEGLNPCHTAECNSFNPDADEETREFFILSLARAENKELELKKLADEHNSIQVNFEPIHQAKRSLINILQQIKER